MLHKISMEEAFKEDPDLVGFLHARDMDVALEVLSRNIQDAWAEPEPPDIRHMVIIRERAVAAQALPSDYVGRIVIASTDEDGNQGKDVYLIRYQADEVCLFHGENWRELFRDP